MVDELWVNIGICRTCWFWNLFLLRTFLKQTWPSCLHCRTQSFQIFGFHKYLGNACTNSENPSGYLWQKVHRRCWCWPYRWSQEARIYSVASSWGMNGHLGTREVSLLHYVQAACHAPTSSLWSLWTPFVCLTLLRPPEFLVSENVSVATKF